ncbi:ras-domain-containing protein [Pisolithus marmoratus]|nr:ras-domain-containing protein [Pisolithus marmoratus]
MTQSPPPPPPQFKIILVGSMSVGKTCLHRRFFDKHSSLDYLLTCGVDFHSEYMQVDGRKVKLGIWDTSGMEKFRAITSPFYRVYDITDRTSFDALPGWLTELHHYVPSTIPKIIVGNKLDQERSRKVSTSDGKSLAASIGALFHEASAKTLVGVTEVFEDLVKKILDAEDQSKSVDTFRAWPQDEIIKLPLPQKQRNKTQVQSMTQTQSSPLQFKIVLVGNTSVGKTCLHRRFFDKQSSIDVAATYGMDLYWSHRPGEYHGLILMFGVVSKHGG